MNLMSCPAYPISKYDNMPVFSDIIIMLCVYFFAWDYYVLIETHWGLSKIILLASPSQVHLLWKKNMFGIHTKNNIFFYWYAR